MAGDWIPIRTNLRDDPTVIFIARATKLDPDHVVGKLHYLWSWVDSHSGDGSLPGVDSAWIDGYVKKRGFAKAMADAPMPWLIIAKRGVSIPRFENWFGMSSKRRLTDTKRKQIVRSLSADCPQTERTKTGLQHSTGQNSIIAPALGAADWDSILQKVRSVAEQLGGCGSARNKRLLLGACALSRCEELGETWFETAIRETRESRPQNIFAYLHSIFKRSAESSGVDFVSSLASLDIPSGNTRATQSEEQPC